MTIQHYSGHIVKVDNLSIVPCAGGCKVTGQVNGITYATWFSRKVGQKDAVKAIADDHVKHMYME